MKAFKIKLSPAQYALFRDALIESKDCGDCSLSWKGGMPSVGFPDYEGVQGTLKRLIAVRTVTAADIRSWESVKRKIDFGVVNQ